ncbi:MAG: dihydropteroate synthase [Deltaproteobacteria bacterium]|nr:dihydropteroate synthase [Deltaproteobacteria bacterium]
MKKGLKFQKRPQIMGILNVTGDSFYDGGLYFELDRAISRVKEMIDEGVDIVDVGGESTRPFSQRVPLEEELERTIPVIKKIREFSDIPISIDTYKAKVAYEAIKAGANIINDISGLSFDKDMAKVAAEFDVPVVIMHIKGKPEDMQISPHYNDVVGEIKEYFRERIEYAKSQGIREENIIIDPGIGFGKRVEDNLKILKSLSDFKEFGRPILIGTSMKSFIGVVTNSPLTERLPGTLASVAISIWNGADIVRVHHVKETKKVVDLVHAIKTS